MRIFAACPLMLAAVVSQLSSAELRSQQDAAAKPETPTADDAQSQARERALTKTRQMLDRRPAHAALFDRYFKLLIQTNSVDAEVVRLEKRLERDAKDRSASLVLGRLLLRAGREDQALEKLDALAAEVGGDDADVQGVLGDIYFKLGRFDAAVRAFAAAEKGATNAESKRVLYEKQGQCQLALGRKEAAITAWRRIGELDGGSFYRRLRVAELLAEANLLEEAAREYGPLITETEADVERHCRVLRDFGQLQELSGNLDQALETYAKVMERTGRGNWLRKAVEDRTVHIYRRTGRLEELSKQLESRVGENPDDLPQVEMLATVLIEMRELGRATEVLAKATPKFPKDVRLARRLAELYVEKEDVDAAIREYQRILSERPEELDLYLELGTLFARGERFSEAKNQWEKALAQNLTDASLCTRIAAMYALWERVDDAARLYERAIELEPDDVVRYNDLAAFLKSVKRHDDALQVLDRALGVARGKPRRLEALVGTFREFEQFDKARECLDAILAVEPNNHGARFGLAQLLLTLGEQEQAIEMLWAVVDAKPGTSPGESGEGYRTNAANTLVNLAARARRIDKLVAEAEQRKSPGAAFVLGRAHSRLRDFESAIAAFQLAVERDPQDVDSRRLLARLHADEGDYEAALEAYRQLGMVAPGQKQRSFREVAKLHLEMFDLDKAIEVWEDAMRLNPDNPAVFLQVGKEFLNIQRIPEALEAFRQAKRLKPRDPDVAFRLAAALRRAGKFEEAEATYLETAKQALVHEDRELARKKLFEIYAEQGRIDEQIESLQRAVQENVYDPHAPQLLADLYLRSNDYVLGLEQLEKSLRFQPRNQSMLMRRAELLEALEEWEQAKVAHEELLKFPDADRDLHLSGVGRALFETGAAEDAKAVFEKIRDRGKVSQLYEKYRLFDEAIEFWKREIAIKPGDVRAYIALSKQLANRNRNDEAIAVLERALDVKPFHRTALNQLGKLYVQADRRDDAVKIGKQLFGLRGEEEKKTRAEELGEIDRRPNRWGWSSGMSWWGGFTQRRLQAAESYFEERGLTTEWGDILVEEARRRPTSLALFSAVQSHYGWRDKSAKKLAAFITELMGRDLRQERIPPGYTLRSFQQRFESSLISVWQEDAAVAEARLEQLPADSTEPYVAVERAVIQKALGKSDEMAASLARAIELDPDCSVARVRLVDHLIENKQFADAVPHLEALLTWWDRNGSKWEREVALRKFVSFRSGRRDRYLRLPRRMRRRVTDEMLLAVDARIESDAFAMSGAFRFPELTPKPFAVILKLASVHSAAKDDGAFDAVIARAEQLAGNLARKSNLGAVMIREKRYAKAEPLLRTLLAEARQLQDDPLQVYFWDSYRWLARTAADGLAQILTDRGEHIEAYQLLAQYADKQKAEGLVREHGKVGDVRDLLTAQVASQAERLQAARGDEGGKDIKATELDYRDSVIKLADFVMAEKDFEAAEEMYQKSLDLLTDDIEILGVLAQLRLRRGDAKAAIATHEETIAAKRRKRRASGGDTATPPTRLRPSVPSDDNQSSNPFGGVFYSGSSFVTPWMMGQGGDDPSVNYRQILQIHKDRNDSNGLLESLRKLIREDPSLFNTMSYELVNLLQNQDLGAKKLPILRMLRGAVKGNDWLALEYAEACRDAGELKEAERALDDLLANATNQDDWYVTRGREVLEQVHQKLGKHKGGVDALREKVAKEPDNVRHRLALADYLSKENDYAAMLEQAEIIVEKAPYMTRAKVMVAQAAAALGDEQRAEGMLRQLFEEAKAGEEKLSRGVNLADWLFGSGRKDEAYAIIDGLEAQAGGSSDFTPSNWYLDRLELDRAFGHLQKELEKQRNSPWYASEIRPRLTRVEMATGREADAVGRSLESIREAGSLGERETRWKELLDVVRRHPEPEGLFEALKERHGKREKLEDFLVLAAVQFAVGDPTEAERDLERAVENSTKEVYLYPLLLGLKRQRHDYQGALKVLDQMERVYGGSSRTQWSASMSLSEKDRVKVERAVVLRKMERLDESDVLIESIADETAHYSFLTLVAIYEKLEEFEKALAWRLRYAEKAGTKSKDDLLAEAKLLMKLDRTAEALKLAEKAKLMAPGDGATRGLLIDIHRKAGTLEQFVDVLAAEYEKDPRSKGLRSSLLLVYGELNREADQRAIFNALLEYPEEREMALRTLLERAKQAEQPEVAIPWQQQLVELKGGKEKKSLYSNLADLYLQVDDVEKAEQAYAKSLDLETANGLRRFGSWLKRRKFDDRAYEAWAKAQELDPTDYGYLDDLARGAFARGEFQQAIDMMLERTHRMRGRAGLSDRSTKELFINCLAGLAEPEREEYLAGGESAESIESAALLHFYRGEGARAQKLVEDLIGRGDAGVLSWQLLRELDDGSDFARRQRILEGLHRRLEREAVTQDEWYFRSLGQSVQTELARLHLANGDVGTTVAMWRAPVFRRISAEASLGSWRSDWDTRYTAKQFMRVQRPEDALEALRHEFLAHETPPWQLLFEVLRETEQFERIESMCWSRLVDPLNAYGVGGDSWNSNDTDNDNHENALVELYRKQGRLEEFESKIEEFAARPETEELSKRLRKRLARIRKDYGWLAKFEAEEFEEKRAKPENVGKRFISDHRNLANRWNLAEDWQKALDHLGQVLDLSDPALPAKLGPIKAQDDDDMYVISSGGGSTSFSPSNPFSFNLQSGGSSWTSYSSRWRGGQSYDRDRRRVMTYLHKLGRTEEALAHEQAYFDGARTDKARETRIASVAGDYRVAKLYTETVRLRLGLLQSETRERKSKITDLSRLALTYKLLEDEVGRREVLEQRLALIDEEMAEKPQRVHLGLKSSRVTVLQQLERWDEAKAQLDELAGYESKPFALESRFALLHRKSGALDTALAIYRRMQARGKRLGSPHDGLSKNQRAHLGLTLAGLGQAEEAKQWLSVVEDELEKDSDLRKEVEEALAKL